MRRSIANTPTKAAFLAAASIALLLAIAAPAARAFHSPPSSSSSSSPSSAAAIRRRSSERQRGRDDGIVVLVADPRRLRPRLPGRDAIAVGLHSTASSSSSSTSILVDNNRPTELPDSLEDAASIAANVSVWIADMAGADHGGTNHPLIQR
jgi:hypothetical protein